MTASPAPPDLAPLCDTAAVEAEGLEGGEGKARSLGLTFAAMPSHLPPLLPSVYLIANGIDSRLAA